MGFGNLGIGGLDSYLVGDRWGSGDSGLDFPFYEEGGYREWDSDTGETTRGTVGDSGWGGTNFLNDFTKGLLGGTSGGQSGSSTSSSTTDRGKSFIDAFIKDRDFRNIGPGIAYIGPEQPIVLPPPNVTNVVGGGGAGGGGSSSGGSSSGGSKVKNAVAGGLTGFAQGGPVGAAIGAFGGLLCDIRTKTDISPLETTEVNDDLAEVAFFVKKLRECA